jgi:hypothetical protein
MKKFLVPLQALLATLPFSSVQAAVDTPFVSSNDSQKVRFVKPTVLKMTPVSGDVPAIIYAQHRSHSSHGSHGSHGSHSSHYSGR